MGMNKQEFLAELKGRLHALGEVEIKKTLAYYSEIIDDRIEEGMTEEQAIESMEPIGAIAEQALQDAPLTQLIRAKKPRNLSAGTIVLLVLGSPVWLPLLIAWLAKVSIIRAGGLKLYVRLLPFFLGLILGGCLMGSFSALVGVLFDIPTYSFWGA